MTIYQAYLGKFAISNDSKDFSIGGSPVALTTGNYFMAGYSGESTTQLCEHIQVKIRALGAPYGSTSVTMSEDGYITIGDLGGVTTITWTDTDLRDLLGFTGNLSGQSGYTATNQARYCWFPTRAIADYPGDLTSFWTPRSTSITYRSGDGTTCSIVGTLINEGKFSYKHLPASNVITTSTTVWESFQRFWTDVIHEGQPFRVLPDRSSYTPTSYLTALWAVQEDEPVGPFSDFVERHVRKYNGLWDLDLQLWEHVS